MYFPECFAMNAGISAMYFLKPPTSFTDKSSTKYAFIPHLANLHQYVGWVELFAKPINRNQCPRWVSRSLSSGAHSRDPLAPPIHGLNSDIEPSPKSAGVRRPRCAPRHHHGAGIRKPSHERKSPAQSSLVKWKRRIPPPSVL